MTDDWTHVFFSGADMDPERVLTALPRASFVARAVANGAGAEETWGVLFVTPGSAPGGALGAVTTDDGRTFSATLVEPPADDEGRLAAARYWELPPRYVQRLASELEQTEPDPEGGF